MGMVSFVKYPINKPALLCCRMFLFEKFINVWCRVYLSGYQILNLLALDSIHKIRYDSWNKCWILVSCWQVRDCQGPRRKETPMKKQNDTIRTNTLDCNREHRRVLKSTLGWSWALFLGSWGLIWARPVLYMLDGQPDQRFNTIRCIYVANVLGLGLTFRPSIVYRHKYQVDN